MDTNISPLQLSNYNLIHREKIKVNLIHNLINNIAHHMSVLTSHRLRNIFKFHTKFTVYMVVRTVYITLYTLIQAEEKFLMNEKSTILR